MKAGKKRSPSIVTYHATPRQLQSLGRSMFSQVERKALQLGKQLDMAIQKNMEAYQISQK